MNRRQGARGGARRVRAAFAVCAIAAPALLLAAPVEYEIDPKHTFPSFEVRHLGISTQRGRFNKTRGTVEIDAEAKRGRIDIDIDASTIDTGDPALEDVLRGEDWFASAKYPAMRFRSSEVRFTNGTPTAASGDLTLRGITLPVELVIENFKCAQFLVVRYVCGADVSTKISRSAFGMTSYRTFVSDEVKLIIQVEAIRKTPLQPTPEAGGS